MGVDKEKIEEIKNNYQMRTKSEIETAKEDNADFSSEDESKIRSKFELEEKASIQKLFDLGPKKLFKLGLSNNPHGWRRGITKSPTSSTVPKRRKQNKIARKTRAQQRKQNK